MQGCTGRWRRTWARRGRGFAEMGGVRGLRLAEAAAEEEEQAAELLPVLLVCHLILVLLALHSRLGP